MTAITDFDSLVTVALDYGKTPDLGEQARDVFVPLANSRLGRDLKSFENERVVDYVNLEPPLALPADYGSVLEVGYSAERGFKILQSMPPHVLAKISRDGIVGPEPAYYWIGAGSIATAPPKQGDYFMRYYAQPALSSTEPENDVLARWPQLYLYAVLLEIGVWTMDTEQRAIALATYDEEIRRVNRQASRARAENPVGVRE